MTSTTQIYVSLLNEGTDVWRPVQANVLGGGEYEILGVVPQEESWQFSPGTHVWCKEKQFADGAVGLVAYAPTAP